jgi:hypothetical protein
MEELKRRAAQLDADVKDLHESTDKNTAALDRVHERLDRGDRDRKLMVAAMIAAVLVIFGVAFVAVRAENTAHETAQIAQEQQIIRNQVLCPILARSVGAYEPDTRQLNPDGSYPGSARDRYVENWKLLKAKYDLLRCTDPLVPPRTTG